jgi:hypothetical protein
MHTANAAVAVATIVGAARGEAAELVLPWSLVPLNSPPNQHTSLDV